jgi:hypothetical protein
MPSMCSFVLGLILISYARTGGTNLNTNSAASLPGSVLLARIAAADTQLCMYSIMGPPHVEIQAVWSPKNCRLAFHSSSKPERIFTNAILKAGPRCITLLTVPLNFACS